MALDAPGSINVASCYMRLPVVSARQCVLDAMEWRLPGALLPSFLHEATHWWCLTTTVGSALGMLANKAKLAIGSADKAELALPAFWRIHVALSVLRPLLEGLALFAEHDVEPVSSRVLSEPLGLAFRLFAQRDEAWRDRAPQAGEMDDIIRAMLRGARMGADGVERRTQVLTTPLDDSSGYLAGYLLVRSLHERAKRCSERARDADLFLMYLRSYLFGDAVLARALLDQAMPARGSLARPTLHRLGRRLRSVVNATLDSRLAAYEESVLAGTEEIASLDAAGEDWAWIRSDIEHESLSAVREIQQQVRRRRNGTEPSTLAIVVSAGIAHRAVIPIAAADGVFSATAGGLCRFAFADGEIELNQANPDRAPGEHKARFVACLIPGQVRDPIFADADPSFTADVMAFACFARGEPIWWAFLECGPRRFGWLQSLPEGERGARLLGTLSSLPLVADVDELGGMADRIQAEIVADMPGAPGATLTAEINAFFAVRALAAIKPKLQERCRAALAADGFWSALKRGSSGDAVRALALLGLCASAGRTVREATERLAELGLDADVAIAQITRASRRLGLPLCDLDWPLSAVGNAADRLIRCFP